jgi:predicted HTH transcriptional regulator
MSSINLDVGFTDSLAVGTSLRQRGFFEQFQTLNDVNDYVGRGQEENLQLDFKTINRADFTRADDKKNLAKALSGFANSSGGIVVWGIVATKNAEGIDGASGVREIDRPALFVNRLNEFTGVAVSPLVEGVRHKPIASNADTGFAVTLVPESDSGPHMAKFHEDRYYKRSGDSFYQSILAESHVIDCWVRLHRKSRSLRFQSRKN